MLEKILSLDEIRHVIIPLLTKYHAEKAILFGSYAKNEADIQSDIDLCIIGGEQYTPTDVFCIADEIYSCLGKDVDVYDISEINKGTEIYSQIFSEGIEIRAE